MKKICTSNEFKEILDCKVVTAVYYRKSDSIEKKEDWMEWMEKNLTADDYSYDLQLQSVVDKRTRKWTFVCFKHFFEPLIEKRKMIKKNIKALQGKNNGGEIVFGIDDEIAKLQGLQEILKLICNTVYGVMASPYFAIGNVVLANNVTGRARVEVWLYSRALNGYMTITDGFQYQPENVFRLKDGIRKPGLRILSDFHKLSKHRGIERISLENLDWSSIFQSENRCHPELDLIDSYAKKHIQTFLGGYNLSMNYDVEHKSENTALKMFYIKRAHYILERRDTREIVYKVRGTSEKENPVFLRIAKSTFECIDNKGNLADIFLNDLDLETYSNRISTLHDYKSSKKRFLKKIQGNKNLIEESKTIEIPGRSKIVKNRFRFNILDFPYKDMKDFQKRNQTSDYVDYGPLLKIMSFENVFQQRLKNFQQSTVPRNG